MRLLNITFDGRQKIYMTYSTTKKVKLVDVANLAECSTATVSRVLNDNPRVSKKGRERVLEAAASLGYVPNGAARALRSANTKLVGVIIPTIDHAIYAIMVAGLQERLAKSGVSLIINTSAYDCELEYKQARILVEHGVETIVLVGTEHHSRTMDLLKAKAVDYVLTYTCSTIGRGAAIGFDNRKAGALAAKYLHSLGHKRFGMITGITKGNDRARERRDGFLSELEALGVTLNSIQILESPYEVSGAIQATKILLNSDPRPTAIFCGSDIIAAGVIKFCNIKGLQVPYDLSVVGFDNLEIASLVSPQLTTLEVPARQMGTLAAEYTLSDDIQRRFLREQELDIKLVVRESSSAPSV